MVMIAAILSRGRYGRRWRAAAAAVALVNEVSRDRV